MSRARHLSHAPIIEAIFDFRVKARSGLRAEEFATVHSQFANRLPKMKKLHGFQLSAKVQPEGQPIIQDQDLGLQGYFFKDTDEKTIAQFRIDGFTFNRLHPYSSWDELFPVVKELWLVYSTVASPQIVTRLALRYINRIPLPPGPISFEEYLRGAPVVPPELPQSVSSFLTRITIHDPEMTIAAHIAQALEVDSEQRLATMLDIDAFKEAEFSVGDPAIEDTFNRLRIFKNLIFFSSLTEQALGLFE
ncbi:MAG TPA: TIGR04255 family protein [Candidatus Methylomirabilis sp.]|nr:TIGR04255 family protein [Candidatus Methylomirabilis sp.]